VEVEEAKRLGREDASAAISLAQEVPLAGTVDPKNLNLPYDWPREYVDSPELPARRVATEWDDYLGEGLPSELPPVLSRFGHGKQASDASEEVWYAWQDGLIETFKATSVLFFPTIHIREKFPDEGTGEYLMLRSMYVTDLRRYKALPSPTWFTESEEEGPLPLERYIQQCFLPLGLSRLAHRRRQREHKKFLDNVPHQVG
jgi:hypothetical protein